MFGGTEVTAIEIEGLRKAYAVRGRQREAVRDLTLHIPSGGVFGLLGPNGAGKSTTLRCLLGLVRADAGRMHVLGAEVPSDLGAIVDRVGCLLERPGFHPSMSGRTNLQLLASLGDTPTISVGPALERLGLASRAEDPVATYSMGMRQRLGLAAALLKDPEIVVLDEPTNGLDPAGIAEMRSLFRELADEGRTVVLSSHLLNEVGLVADRVAILSEGRSIFDGALDELLGAHGPTFLEVRIDDREAARAVLTSAGFSVSEVGGSLHIEARPSEAPVVGERLAAHGMYPHHLTTGTVDLETVFLRLTGSVKERDDASVAG